MGYSKGREVYPPSQIGGSTGAGVFCRELGLELHFRLNDECSVFQAEIFTILKAIVATAGGPTSDSESYMISVDCQAALRVITSIWCKSRLVRECKESLRAFGPCWVLDHNGILGNETANAPATLGSLSESDLLVDPDPPICHLYGFINGWIRGKSRGVRGTDQVMFLDVYVLLCSIRTG